VNSYEDLKLSKNLFETGSTAQLAHFTTKVARAYKLEFVNCILLAFAPFRKTVSELNFNWLCSSVNSFNVSVRSTYFLVPAMCKAIRTKNYMAQNVRTLIDLCCIP
ncbi:hypothetical protein L9F63_005806, partial [Diploptera punctata]